MILVTRFYAHGHGLKGIRQRPDEVKSRDKIHVLVACEENVFCGFAYVFFFVSFHREEFEFQTFL